MDGYNSVGFSTFDGLNSSVPVFQIATVVAVDNGNPPSVTVDSSDIMRPVLSFQLETGQQGAQGIQGVQGNQGPQGAKGDKGSKGDSGSDGDSSAATAAAGVAAAAATVASGASIAAAGSATAAAASTAASAASAAAAEASIAGMQTEIDTIGAELTDLTLDVSALEADMVVVSEKVVHMASVPGVSTIIDCPTISIGEVTNLNLNLSVESAAGLITIGPADQLGTVVANGLWVFPSMENFLSFTSNSGFVTQF